MKLVIATLREQHEINMGGGEKKTHKRKFKTWKCVR